MEFGDFFTFFTMFLLQLPIDFIVILLFHIYRQAFCTRPSTILCIYCVIMISTFFTLSVSWQYGGPSRLSISNEDVFEAVLTECGKDE
jgi:hypothetical protein